MTAGRCVAARRLKLLYWTLIAYVVTRPWHVSVNEVLIRPTEQVG